MSTTGKSWIKGIAIGLPLLYFVAAFIMAAVATHGNYYNFTTDQYLGRAHMPINGGFRVFVGQPTRTRIQQAKAGDKSWFFLEAHKRDLRMWLLHGKHGYRLIVPHNEYSTVEGVRNEVQISYLGDTAGSVAKHWTYSFGDLVKLHGQRLTAHQPGIEQTDTWYDISHGGLGAFLSRYMVQVDITLKPKQYAAYLAHS